MSCLLYLVRHGETDWNRENRIQGRSDRPLSEKGRTQAKAVAMKFSSHSFSAIYSSPLVRCSDTATKIAEHHECDIFYHDDLQEGICGDLEGITKEQFISKYKKKIEKMKKLPFSGRFNFKIVENAESPAEIAMRAMRCIKTIAMHHLNQTVLVVTHGWFMRSLFIALNNEVDEHSLFAENTAILTLEGNGHELSVADFQGFGRQSSWV